MSNSNVQLIRRWVETANCQDGDRLAGMYAENAVYTSPKGVVEGRSAIHRAFLNIFDVTPDLVTEIVNIFGEGEHVALEMVARGRTVKPHPSFPGSSPGLRIENHGVHVFRIRDGEIVADTAYYDLAKLIRRD